ncbi:Auxin responsive SAUR protein [Cynara cardunculus var. scolymus]|uniref:Auxin responsive SAUR protein n=1 Tax=Cynara cardunculus var. scolymus TaxID=59895 RepID=A0A124SFS1_CYNCS|nr:Auxin responsive SAUR protein [Cynara cardunculus var. scolymus]
MAIPKEEEFGYNRPMGGLTIPCREDIFTDLVSRLGNTTDSALFGKMTIFMPRIIQAKQILRRSLSNGSSNTYMAIPKGYFAVYVGDQEKKRFVVPIALLGQPAFQELLCQAEEKFGYNHPMGGFTIPCSKDMFIDLASRLGAL